MNYEVERKFLLKNLPDVKYDRNLLIHQYYLPDDGEWTERVRKITEDNESRYLKTRKLRVGKLTNEEIEIEISREEYEETKTNAISKIIKTRHIIRYGEYTWEIDKFNNIHLILAELEMVTNDDNLKDVVSELNSIDIPRFIKSNLVMEVTDIPEMSNKSLSIPI